MGLSAIWVNIDKGYLLRGGALAKDDRIKWVEWKLQQRVEAEEGKIGHKLRAPSDEYRADHGQLDAEGVPDQKSLEVWLAKERDGLSWNGIVIRFFPQYSRKSQKSGGMSKARRVHGVVKRALEPSVKEEFRQFMVHRIDELFGCTPENFKRYLLSIKIKNEK